MRPSNPHSGAVHAFLRALRAAGFEGASVPVGIEGDGRERLVFIEGEVPTPPYPDWAQSDDALASIAGLMARLHRAARSFNRRPTCGVRRWRTRPGAGSCATTTCA